MAYIYNIKNDVLSECLNNDVIKVCRKDPLNYLVNDNKVDLEKEIAALKGIDSNNKPKPLNKMNKGELLKIADELGIEIDESLTNPEIVEVIKKAQEELSSGGQ